MAVTLAWIPNPFIAYLFVVGKKHRVYFEDWLSCLGFHSYILVLIDVISLSQILSKCWVADFQYCIYWNIIHICDPAPLNEALWGSMQIEIYNSLQYTNLFAHFNSKNITLLYSYQKLQHVEHRYVWQHSKQFCRDVGSQRL